MRMNFTNISWDDAKYVQMCERKVGHFSVCGNGGDFPRCLTSSKTWNGLSRHKKWQYGRTYKKDFMVSKILILLHGSQYEKEIQARRTEILIWLSEIILFGEENENVGKRIRETLGDSKSEIQLCISRLSFYHYYCSSTALCSHAYYGNDQLYFRYWRLRASFSSFLSLTLTSKLQKRIHKRHHLCFIQRLRKWNFSPVPLVPTLT